MKAPLLETLVQKIKKALMMSETYYNDLNDIKDKTSYYYTSASATNKPPQANGTNGYVFTHMANDNVGYQTYKTINRRIWKIQECNVGRMAGKIKEGNFVRKCNR